MKLFNWQLGRQGSGYEVLTLLYSKLLKADCYILRYPEKASIPAHTDPVDPEHKHYRLNIQLWPAQEGGELICAHSLFRVGPINFFRPDESIHAVTEVKKGTRYVLSIGWRKKKK
jgi:hypothetical protein